MFGIPFDRLVVIVLAALFVLGPERLPAAMTWLGRAVRTAREYVDTAQGRIHTELGPELAQLREPLEELRKPLAQLRSLRDPRRAVTRWLTDEMAGPATPDLTPSRRPGADA